MISAFVSIATASHLAFSKVAFASVESSCVSTRKVLYLLGSQSLSLADAVQGFEVRHVEDHIPGKLLAQIVSRYTAAEACFALKPYVMAALLAEGADSVHYIDSDTCFFADAAVAVDGLDGADILLTPHYLKPFPQDSERPRLLTLLRAGVFNGGYVGVANTRGGHEFLSWWGHRLLRHCQNDPVRGICGDQRWLDLVPALFPGLRIWRHPGANVAYWNLHERSLSRQGEVYRCEEHPLLFFHFSGFDPYRPESFSCYQTRTDPRQNPALSEMLVRYADQLMAGGFETCRHHRYEYRRWWHGNGVPARLGRRWIRWREAHNLS